MDDSNDNGILFIYIIIYKVKIAQIEHELAAYMHL